MWKFSFFTNLDYTRTWSKVQRIKAMILSNHTDFRVFMSSLCALYSYNDHFPNKSFQCSRDTHLNLMLFNAWFQHNSSTNCCPSLLVFEEEYAVSKCLHNYIVIYANSSSIFSRKNQIYHQTSFLNYFLIYKTYTYMFHKQEIS